MPTFLSFLVQNAFFCSSCGRPVKASVVVCIYHHFFSRLGTYLLGFLLLISVWLSIALSFSFSLVRCTICRPFSFFDGLQCSFSLHTLSFSLSFSLSLSPFIVIKCKTDTEKSTFYSVTKQ